MDTRINNLRAFLDASVSAYHAIANLSALMAKEGYQKLSEQDAWNLVPGGKYYLVRGGSAIIAFRVPMGEPAGFMLSASHSDRPCFKLKENLEQCNAYARMATETYGGMLMGTWLDRPLSIAGRVMVETENGFEEKLVNIDKDLALIPNMAIHMNREANNGVKINPAVDTLPLMGGKDTAGKLKDLLEKAAGGKILGHDLFLYPRQKAAVWGIEEEYISSAALDDLECAWGCTQGFLKAAPSNSIPVLCVFDNEEVGSMSAQGAGSRILETQLVRICEALNLNLARMLAQSFMVSADNAHAIHPNHPEVADAANAPVMNQGVVMKFNSNLSYCTNGHSAAVFRKVADKAGVPVQAFYNRADTRGGSTLGHVSLAHVSIPTVDIGLPQLAMHSCYETAGVKDALYLVDVMTAFYGTSLEMTETGCNLK